MPTLPPIVPDRTTAGITVDPKTLERVVPQTKRSDGSVRKEIKIRPGFTPQEDIGRFKTSRQQIAEKNVLPKGHIIGWVPPSSQSQSKSQSGSGSGGGVKVPTTDGSGQPLSKAALKNAKRKAKKIAEKAAASSTVSGAQQESEEEKDGEKLVVGGAVDDAPETWEDERDEEEVPSADIDTLTPLDNDTCIKGKQRRGDSGVEAVTEELDKLTVSK